MLRQRDILKAVEEILKSLFQLEVYMDERQSQENFQTPCFFIELETVTIRPSNINADRCEKECYLAISYVTEKDACRAADLYDMKDALMGAFWRGFRVQDRTMNVMEITGQTTGDEMDVLYMELHFSYMDADKATDESVFIRNVYYNGHIRSEV